MDGRDAPDPDQLEAELRRLIEAELARPLDQPSDARTDAPQPPQATSSLATNLSAALHQERQPTLFEQEKAALGYLHPSQYPRPVATHQTILSRFYRAIFWCGLALVVLGSPIAGSNTLAQVLWAGVLANVIARAIRAAELEVTGPMGLARLLFIQGYAIFCMVMLAIMALRFLGPY